MQNTGEPPLRLNGLLASFFARDGVTIYNGDCRAVLRQLPACSVNCCVTSPPYWGLRDYGHDGQIGLETTPNEYVAELVAVFREVRRVLRDDGTLWLNLGDSYARAPEKGGSGTPNGRNTIEMGYGAAQASKVGSSDGLVGRGERPGSRAIGDGLKPKDLVGIPWRVAFALQADGWYLRQDIIWAKPNPMPESVTDRCTKSHEYLFLLAKSERYHCDMQAIAEPVTNFNETGANALRGQGHMRDGDGPANREGRDMKAVGKKSGNKAKTWGNNETEDRGDGDGDVETHRGIPWEGTMRNKRSVWTVTTRPYAGAHFATFPPALIEPCIRAGCPEGGTVLDPFLGSGTTAEVGQRLGCRVVGIELTEEYAELAASRFRQSVLFHAGEHSSYPQLSWE